MDKRKLGIFSALLATTVLYAAAGTARAAVVNVGNHTLLPNQANQLVDITVTDAVGLKDFNLYADLGGGGPEIADYGYPAGIAGPTITGASTVGTVWASHAFTDAQALSLPQFLNYFVSLTTPGDSINGDGTLIVLNVDTSGYTSGTWALKLGNTATGDSSDFGLIAAPTINNGSISIQAATVPEPASLGLLALGGLALLRRRR